MLMEVEAYGRDHKFSLSKECKTADKEGPAPVETDRVINMAYIMGHESGEKKRRLSIYS
jgi:hypothetical protein